MPISHGMNSSKINYNVPRWSEAAEKPLWTWDGTTMLITFHWGAGEEEQGKREEISLGFSLSLNPERPSLNPEQNCNAVQVLSKRGKIKYLPI